MAAGLSFDRAINAARRVYDWHSDFVNADVRGVSGARIDYINNRNISSSTPVTIIFTGFNNLKHLDESEENIVKLYGRTLTRLQQQSWIVYCVGIPPMDHGKSDVWYPEGASINNDRIINIDAGIEKLCGSNYIDTPSFWTESDTDDGIHPNQEGYRKIVAELKSRRLLSFFVWLSDKIPSKCAVAVGSSNIH